MSTTARSTDSSPPSPARKSNRERRRPSRFVARPSKQGLSVEDGDAIFALLPQMQLSGGRVAELALRSSKRIREKNTSVKKPDAKETFQSDGGRILPMRGARNRSTLSQEDYVMPYATARLTDTKVKQESKRTHAKKRPVAATASVPEPKGSGASRRPRVIVIGAGISGLACARELSERRHDVLVLEARNRMGGRLRTVDLMMEDVSNNNTSDNEGSDLFNVRKWSSVDVGGAFIHGTGQYTTRTDDSSNVGSHDFGTSRSKAKQTTEQPKENLRKSSRLSIDYDALSQRQSKEVAPVNNRNLNPVYVLASRKLRLPVQAAEGAFTCLVDHEGDLISEQVDEEVSREFNEVLDLATKCCESGFMPVFSDSQSNQPEQPTKSKKKPSPRKANKAPNSGEESPNYVSDDTSDSSKATQWKKLDPNTDFGTIFEECRQYNSALNKSAKTYSAKETEEVRNYLFQWHVANLEMSSGAPMHKLGQRWNDDEPFGYGGDHSYLEGGFRDVIEALSDGFDCRGVGDKSLLNNNEWARRSGDLAGCFSMRSPDTTMPTSQPRGIIQCGIEVRGVEIVEKADAKMLRKRRRVTIADPSKCRRSSRENRGGKMTEILGSLSNRQHSETNESNGPSVEPDDKIQTASYANGGSTVVRVTTACGLTLEADAVVVTLPVAILKVPRGLPGHVTFNPPLSKAKQNALSRLGVGTYNKCIMSFSHPFWKHLPSHLSSSSSAAPSYWNDPNTHRFDFIGHASDEHGKDILFFNIRNAPILVAIYGGSEYSKEIESLHDREVVAGCMDVLRKIFDKATSDCRLTRSQINDLTVPEWPLDYFVSRWGSDPFSRGSFSYIPQGVDGIEELKAMSQPVYDYRPEGKDPDDKPRRPLILFAGEGTSPYHPSTIHGAFETGIREAYRLDLALEPGLNQFKFEESYLYQPTFSVRPDAAELKLQNAPRTQKTEVSNHQSFTAVGDALILRGVETFSSSAETFDKIKEKMLDQDVASVSDIKSRYSSLVNMLSNHWGQDKGNNDELSFDKARWDLPGKEKGTWLASDVPQPINKNTQSKTATVKPTKKIEPVVTIQSRSGRKIQRRSFEDCIQFS